MHSVCPTQKSYFKKPMDLYQMPIDFNVCDFYDFVDCIYDFKYGIIIALCIDNQFIRWFAFYRSWDYIDSYDAALYFSRYLYKSVISFLSIYFHQYDSSVFRTTYHEERNEDSCFFITCFNGFAYSLLWYYWHCSLTIAYEFFVSVFSSKSGFGIMKSRRKRRCEKNIFSLILMAL